ncbi:ornithine cyclodeaminase family protein [Ktedonosporobacter rubrisoli]|uniref:Ornithine cyclodeaminase family protein n=1 Tax=Ktedonosporobacter rubrisoli TaxID=2509675 RepID=A0A4P6JR20_KTERU|nr:ornithine cyclodeaminase family protein [Ktedonosporobacter rubrisoli]QBD77723.1 ornithine cyclodeaminase family protein [Ktedonosporobacter rubrisoli]
MALVLREKHVRSLLSMHDTMLVLEEAFCSQLQGMAVNQPRIRMMFPNSVMNMLAAAIPADPFWVMGFKTYTAFREGVRYVVMLFSAQNGQLLAIIEASWLGSMRTGGASALATRYLARPDSTIVGLIGSGKQAVTQLMGICNLYPSYALCPISCVYVYSRDARKCEIFCQEMTRVLNVDVVPVSSARQAVESADILITATTSWEPVFRGEWLKPGCHINAIGSNWAQRRELDLTTLDRCSLITTDSIEQARTEAGDFIIPADEGLFDWPRVHSLAEIMGPGCLRRETPEAITLYKGLGIALEDIATAAHIYCLALREGLGEEVDLLS